MKPTGKSKRKPVHAHANSQTQLGQPICAVLKDGSYYIGRVEGIKNGELILSGLKGSGRLHPHSEQANRVQVSGFMNSLLGGGAGGQIGADSGGGSAGGAGLGGIGGLGGMLSTIRIGMNMIQAIMPLLSFFKL
jgi:hypothetical protein